MFIYHSSHGMALLLLYVDDIIVTGSSSLVISNIIQKWRSKFDIKDLGDLHFFLGMEAHRDSSGFTLTQSKYAIDLLKRSNMAAAIPSKSPVISGKKFSAHDGDPLSDVSSYRSIVGALQYNKMTPDLAYAVNQVCQFMHQSRTSHLAAVKRIWRYIKGTVYFGLRITKSADHSLIAYSDADWAGCPDDRRSTVIAYSMVQIWSHGALRSNELYPGLAPKLNIEL